MSLANGYDEISSQGKIKLLKEGINLITPTEYASEEEQARSIAKGIKVVGYSVTNNLEGLKLFNKEQRAEKKQQQYQVRETQEKTFSLDDFGEQEI